MTFFSSMRRLTAASAGAALMMTLGVAADAAEWRAWNIHVEGYPNTVAMDKFAELVAEKTGGNITVKNFHAGVLGSQPDAIEQVRIGALEIGNFNLGPIGPIAPKPTSSRCPSSSRTWDTCTASSTARAVTGSRKAWPSRD